MEKLYTGSSHARILLTEWPPTSGHSEIHIVQAYQRLDTIISPPRKLHVHFPSRTWYGNSETGKNVFMKTTRHSTLIFALLFILLGSLVGHAEPDNVLVGNLTFTRPDRWRWAEPTKTSSALTRFIVSSQTDVRFYVVNKDVSTEKASILHQFPEASANDLAQDEMTIGKQKIIFYTISGTYKYKDLVPRPHQLWVSAAIPRGKQFIYARIMGPSNEVEECVAKFRNMVETAVKEQQANES